MGASFNKLASATGLRKPVPQPADALKFANLDFEMMKRRAPRQKAPRVMTEHEMRKAALATSLQKSAHDLQKAMAISSFFKFVGESKNTLNKIASDLRGLDARVSRLESFFNRS